MKNQTVDIHLILLLGNLLIAAVFFGVYHRFLQKRAGSNGLIRLGLGLFIGLFTLGSLLLCWLLTRSEHNIFVAFNLLAIQCFFSLPSHLLLFGLYHTFYRPKPEQRGTAIILPVILAGLIFLFAGYAYWYEPHNLQIDTYRLSSPKLHGLTRPIRIVQFTDLQPTRIGPEEERIMAAVLALEPDIFLLTGDYTSLEPPEFARNLAELQAYYGRLTAPFGSYAVDGNMEPPDWERLFAGSGITPLSNRSVDIPVNGVMIRIFGLNLSSVKAKIFKHRELPLPESDPTKYTILLSHIPDAVRYLRPEHGIDLVLAGHTHGGQVRLPWFGPLVTFSYLERQYAAGLHDYHGTNLLVSRGLGLERGEAPQIRINCSPEIVVIELTGETKE
jgi:predicted MPP superfamily phosphohydrolase